MYAVLRTYSFTRKSTYMYIETPLTKDCRQFDREDERFALRQIIIIVTIKTIRNRSVD